MHGAGGDQHVEVDRGAADRRGGRETQQADHEQPFAAEQISQPAPEQQQAAEGERVGRHHPLAIRVPEAQIPLRRGQRDIHHRRVQHDHQLRDAQHRQDPPPLGVGLNAGTGVLCAACGAVSRWS